MSDYKAPINDIHFVRTELLDFDSHYTALPGCEEVNSELTDAILAEAAKFAEQVLAPLYQSADREGCHWSEQQVTTPNGFKQAYQQFIDGGWPALSAPTTWGGQGLPVSIDMMVTEIIGAANHAWAMYPILGNGARHTLLTHSTTELQQRLLPKLVSGHWTGTMCLTEPQGGSDLSNLHTKAEPLPDGSYKITGTKIFISSGDHDMAENIVHIVLARLPDAPAGTRGISLFAVPKYQVNEQGEAGESNHVICSALEEKMGIHGNATCVLNFDGATGYLMGEPHQGLPCMFTFMNSARILIAMQGLSHAERALQCAWPYACERLAGRSLSGIKNPDGPADPLIAHADVRRMLFTIRSLAEGHRMLAHAMMQWVDQELYASDQQVRQQATNLLSFLTPITKGFMTETCLEAASLGIQVLGGHGYIREWGLEQNLRDARISTIYEGTTGIQALDLLGRKTLKNNGELLALFCTEVNNFCAQIPATQQANPTIKGMLATLTEYLKQWQQLTVDLGQRAANNADEVGAAAFDYLMYAGYIVSAYYWLQAALCAQQALDSGQGQQSNDFYRVKLATANFYFDKMLPRAKLHAAGITSGAASLMALSNETLLKSQL